MIHRVMALAPAVFTGISLLALPAAHAQDVKLPPTMTFTAYDTGTAGFNIAVAVGKMLKDKYGTDVRVLPAGNDVARLAPLRAGRAMSSAMGSGTYFAQEGVFEFGAREWGPQALQLVLSSVDCNGGSLGVATRYRRQGDQGPQGQARRLRRRLAGAEPELAGDHGFRRPQAKRRQDRRILQLRRDVEGPGQQRHRCRLRHHHHRPRQGSRDLAARPGLAAAAPQRQGRLGPRAEGRIVLLPPHVATCGAGISKDKPIETRQPIRIRSSWSTDRKPPIRSTPSPRR